MLAVAISTQVQKKGTTKMMNKNEKWQWAAKKVEHGYKQGSGSGTASVLTILMLLYRDHLEQVGKMGYMI